MITHLLLLLFDLVTASVGFGMNISVFVSVVHSMVMVKFIAAN